MDLFQVNVVYMPEHGTGHVRIWKGTCKNFLAPNKLSNLHRRTGATQLHTYARMLAQLLFNARFFSTAELLNILIRHV